MKDWWSHIYQYEIGFENIMIKQADLDRSETYLRDKFGQAKYIKLIPQNKDFKLVYVDIPNGALPIYRRKNRCGNSIVEPSMWFLVGYELMGVRNLIMVDSKSGSISLITEKVPGYK